MTYPDPYGHYPPPGPPQPPAWNQRPVSGLPVSPGYQPVSGHPYSPPPGAYLPPHVVVTQARPTSGTATASMVLGIIGVLGGWCLFGIPCILAVILGHIALPATKDGTVGGRGMAVTGLILGYLFVIPMIIFTVMVFGGMLAASTPTPTPTP